VSESPSAGPRKDLDDLIAQFEEEVRSRPTPDEMGATDEAEETEEALAPAAPELPMAPPASQEPLVPAASPPPTVAPAPAPVAAPALPAEVEDLHTWWSGGERVELDLRYGGKLTVFTRVLGNGPWLTLVHGFPTSSWDWAPVAPELSLHYRLLAFDLVGFGDSDKPSGHDWSAFEQADVTEAIWRHFEVNETRMVAHDVGLTVALELLARQEEGKLAARISDFTLLNGGIYSGFHRPRRVQQLLQKPILGLLIARLLSEPQFGKALAEVFSPTHQPTPNELHQQWESVVRRGGSKNYHRLIKYIPERRANKDRWETAVEKTEVPIRFVWGMADPVSGAHMAEVIEQRRPGADIVRLEDVGHYPQLEAPQRVASAIIEGPRPRPTHNEKSDGHS
jgi:pimeloyl-ACP methyl ester carboxylesterase